MKQELMESFAGMTAREIKDTLEGMCETGEEMQIRRELLPEERTKMEQELATKSINCAILKERFETAKQLYKTESTPLNQRNDEIIKSLRANAIEIEGMVYSVADQDSSQMLSFDENGNFLQSRPLLPEERQRSIAVDSLINS